MLDAGSKHAGAAFVGRPTRPVMVWATAGGVIFALQLALILRWVTGPNFARVPGGPDQPPGWMRFVLAAGQGLIVVAAVGFLYWFVVRPWRRNRRLPFEGCLALALIPTSIFDPLSNGTQAWISYNAHMLNRGSPVVELPGWLSPSGPGVAPAWPLVFAPAGYVLMPLLAILGCGVMRWVKRRFPSVNAPGQILACIVFLYVFEVVMEGAILLPLGFYSYPGGMWAQLFAGTYHQLPLYAVFHTSLVWTAFSALRYYIDDRGLSPVERGLASVGGGRLKQDALRVLALLAAANVSLFLLFNGPGLLLAANAGEYPADVKARSYFLNQCGERVNRACPGPGVPIVRPGSGYVDWSGQYIGPGPDQQRR